MASEIQERLAETKKILRIVKIKIKAYLERMVELEKEFIHIAKWKLMKRFRNYRQRELLTRNFKREMLELGVFV